MRGGGRVLALTASVAFAASASAPLLAQTDDELAAARRLFTQAVADEEGKRFDTALEEFRRVAAVRETANVRYRIATCLEALGRRVEALASYRAAARLAVGDRTAADVAHAADEHASQLDRVLPALSVVLPPDAPPGTTVRVDDAPVDSAALRDPMRLEPGAHTIAATAPGDLPFRTAVTLPEGGHVSITVTFEKAPAAPLARGAGDGVVPKPLAVPAPVDVHHGAPAGAWIALGLGAALAAGSVVSFVLRASNLSTLDQDCTSTGSGVSCPQSLASTVNQAHDAAAIEGPLGIGLAAGAAVSVGIGVWLLVSTPSSRPAQPSSGSVSIAPVLSPHGGALVLGASL